MKRDELKPCPFCGGKPRLYEENMDVGAGDCVYLCRIICECAANPVVYMEGEHGYRQPEDTPNSEAKANAINAWNTRTANNTDTIKSAFSAELCAREILNEAIKSMAETVLNMSDKDQRHQSIIQPLFGAVEKLKDKYNE